MSLGLLGLAALVLTPRQHPAPVSKPAVGARPDFSSLLPANRLTGITAHEVAGTARPTYLVGYVGDRYPEVARVEADASGAWRKTSAVPLNFSGRVAVPDLRAIPFAGGTFYLAMLDNGDGWKAVFLLDAAAGGLRLVQRLTPMSDIPPQYLQAGQAGDRHRLVRFGDIDNDGYRAEVLVEKRTAGQVQYEVYRYNGSNLSYDADLTQEVTQSENVFARPAEEALPGSIMVDGQAGQPAVFIDAVTAAPARPPAP